MGRTKSDYVRDIVDEYVRGAQQICESIERIRDTGQLWPETQEPNAITEDGIHWLKDNSRS